MPTSSAISFASSSLRAARPAEIFVRYSARVAGVRLRPRLERGARGLDRAVDVLGGAFGDAPHHLLRSRS